MLEQQPEQQLEEDLTHIAALAEEEVVLVERGKPASESRCGPSKALAGVVGERLVSRGGGARAVRERWEQSMFLKIRHQRGIRRM